VNLHPETKFYYCQGTTNIPLRYKDIVFRKCEESAMMYCTLPKYIPIFKNIQKLFMSQAQSSSIPHRGFLYEFHCPEDIGGEVTVTRHVLSMTVKDELSVPSTVEGLPPTLVSRVLSYGESRKGLCGSVVVGDLNTPNPILGIHIAGLSSGRVGYAEVVLQDTLMQVKSGSLSEADSLVPQLPLSDAKLKLVSNVEPLYVVPRELAHSSPGRSKLEHSMCYEEFFKSTFDRPVLHPNDTRLGEVKFSPIQASCHYHGWVPTPFEDKFFLPALSDYRDLVLSVVRPARGAVGKLSVDEAVVGLDLGGYDMMEMSTSEGFPFISSRPRGATNKAWLFDINYTGCRPKLVKINPLLQQVLDQKESVRLSGLVPETIFIDCLKDQKLPREKILIPGKTRIFSISPVDYTIQFRQYFLDFLVSMQNARLECEHAIGINKDSLEWTQLVKILLDLSQCIVTGDYSKFGPTLMHKVVAGCFDIIFDWYKKFGDLDADNDLCRRSLAEECMHSKHLMLDLIYRVFLWSSFGLPNNNNIKYDGQ